MTKRQIALISLRVAPVQTNAPKQIHIPRNISAQSWKIASNFITDIQGFTHFITQKFLDCHLELENPQNPTERKKGPGVRHNLYSWLMLEQMNRNGTCLGNCVYQQSKKHVSLKSLENRMRFNFNAHNGVKMKFSANYLFLKHILVSTEM